MQIKQTNIPERQPGRPAVTNNAFDDTLGLVFILGCLGTLWVISTFVSSAAGGKAETLPSQFGGWVEPSWFKACLIALGWYAYRRCRNNRRELQTRILEEAELKQRDAILETISTAASLFLEEDIPCSSKFTTCLQALGKAMHVSRAFVFKHNVDRVGLPCLNLEAEWVMPSAAEQADAIKLQDIACSEPVLECILAPLRAGKSVQMFSNNAPAPLHHYLEQHGIKSLAFAAIHIQGRFWGFLGIEEHTFSRHWSNTEIEGLTTTAALLGSALRQDHFREEAAEVSQRLSSILATTPGLIFTATPTRPMKITYISSNLFDLLGYLPEAARNSNHFALDIIHPEDLERSTKALELLWSSGQPVDLEARYRRADGTYLWMHVRIILVRDSQGTPKEYVGTGMDITERMNSRQIQRERENMYREMFEAGAVQLLIDPRTYQIVDGNNAACAFYGYSREGLRAMSILDISTTPEEILAERFSVSGPSILSVSAQHRIADGSVRDVEAHIGKITSNGQSYLYVIVQDISQKLRAEEALVESRERYQSLFENAPISLWEEDFSGIGRLFDQLRAEGVVDLEAHIEEHPDLVDYCASLVKVINVNQATMDLYHCTDKNELLADLTSHLPLGDFRSTFAMELIKLYSGMTRWVKETHITIADGETRHLLTHVHVVPGFEASLGKVLISMLDITATKQSQAALARERALLRAIIEAIPDPLFYKDLDGRYLGCNAAFGEPAEIIGRSDVDIFPMEEAERLKQRAGLALRQDRTLTSEQWMTFPNGARLLELHITPLHGAQGDTQGVIGIGRDITMRKRLEHELKKARDSAEAANKAKGDFLANISHELRTPLNGILGMADVALLGDLPGDTRRSMEIIGKSGRRLLHIVNDLIDFSHAEAGLVNLADDSVELRQFLESLLDGLRPMAVGKDIQLSLDIAADVPPVIRADAHRLGQVLSNLVSNAIKFTTQGFCRVTVEPLAQRGEFGLVLHERRAWLRFMVQDSGIGISPDKNEAIFEPFIQVDGSFARSQGGTGLGLSIVKQLVTAMGGRVHVESTPGMGSSFFLDCPFSLPDALRSDAGAQYNSSESIGAVDLAPREALRRLDDNEELYERLLDIFARDARNKLLEIHVAMKDGEVLKARETLQWLKGRAATIAANKTAALANRLEVYLKEGDAVHASRLLTELEEAMTDVLAVIHARHSTTAPQPQEGEITP